MHAPGSLTGLIEYRKFLQLIAESVHPDPVDLPGLPGVLGKRHFHPGTGVYTVREPLTAEDHAVLQTLLGTHKDKLPRLEAVMAAEGAVTFLRAYRALPDAPPWEPALRTEHDVAEFNSQRRRTRDAHDNAIKEAVAQGRMRLFDVDRLPVAPSIHIVTYMHSEDAHAYIAAIALDPSATLHATGLLLGTRSPSSKRDPGAASTVSSSGQPLKSTRRRWTATDRQQLTELARTGQISVAVEKFGIPEQYAKQLVARFAKEDAVRPLAPAGAGRAPVVDARPVASLDSDPHRPGPASASLATPTTNTKVSPDSQEPPTRACAPEAPAAAAPPPRARHPAAKVIVRIREVEQRTGLKRSSIYARLNPKSKYYDPTFPRRVLLTGKPALEEGNNKGAVGFIEEDIDRWISSREMP